MISPAPGVRDTKDSITMKRSAIFLALIVMLLSAVIGFHGCGNTNNLTAITVIPADPIITKTTSTQTTQQFSAIAHFSDGLSVALWSQVKWQSSDPTILNINTDTGVATAIKPGTVVITAIDNAHPTITGSSAAIVVELLSISITPSVVSIPVGTVQQFAATGAYSSATPSTASTDLTRLVTWSTSNPAIATIGNILGTHGMATAVSAGTTTITAKDPATGIVSTQTATLTVL
jgi:hypothetical protein